MTWVKYWDQLRSFAFGEMNMKPSEFYEMSLEDFSLKLDGFLDSRIWLERSMRRLGQIVQAPHVDSKAPSMMKQWPIAKDDEMRGRASARSRERGLQILKMFKENPATNLNPK